MNPKNESYKKENLRQRAEQILHTQPEQLDRLPPEEVRQVIHELLVHQIELELQNEELRSTKKTLEDTRTRYDELYHNAPVGYVVLDPSGIIKQTNRFFARLVKRDGSLVTGKPFADLLVDADAALFRARFRVFLNNPVGKTMAVRIGRGDTVDACVQLAFISQQESRPDQSQDERLITISDISERKHAETLMASALRESRIREKEIEALLKGARAVLAQNDFQTTARRVFDYCKDLIGASSGYVALLSDEGEENEVMFLEAGGLPCDVDPELPMPIRGLRAEAYKFNKAVYHNDFMNSQWVDFMPNGHVILRNVMFAPLVLERKTVGIIGLANKPSDFNDNDTKMAAGFGELAAIALQNSRNLDERINAETQREKVIQELKKALSEVKRLSGLLPICAHCKKIRDDKGYWNKIESYIQQHSDAAFSHSICRDCARKYYPDFDIYDD